MSGAPTFTPNDWHIVELTYDGAGTITVRVDGLAPATSTGRALAVVPNPLLLGQGRWLPASDFDLTGLFIYNRVLSSLERTEVLNYLNSLLVPPLPMTGLTVWMQAEQFAVTSWPNQGSAPAPAIVSGESYALWPELMPNSLNGKPAVRFKANGGRVRGTGLCADGSFDLTVIYIARMWGPNLGRIWTNKYPPYNFLIGAHSAGYDSCYDGGWIAGPNPHSAAPQPWRMWGYVTSNVPREARFYVNGVVTGTGSSAGADNRWNISGYSDAYEETCDCEVAEILSWNRALSVAERQQVEAYLTAKYGAL